MNKLTISTKLIVLATMATVIISAFGIFSISNISTIEEGVTTMYYDRVIPLKQLKYISDAYAVDIIGALQKVDHGKETSKETIRRIQNARNLIATNWDDYMKTKFTHEEEGHAKEVQDLLDQMDPVLDDVLAMLKRNDTIALRSFIENDLYSMTDSLTKQISDLSDLQLSASGEIHDEADILYRSTRRDSIIIMVGAILLIVFSSFFIIMNIKKKLKIANEAVSRISAGDLVFKINNESHDEIGMLTDALGSMQERLKDIITNVLLTANNVAEASLQLSNTSQEISQGASEQASSVEEVSSSVEEMSGNIQQNTDYAQDTFKIAKKAAEDISAGSEKVFTTVEAMKKIAAKISIIGEIAFQTNILALNAAVEAARAGEHGKGFGVVAAEVGKLADRSKIAAAEINEITGISVKIAEEAGEIMKKIIPDIQKTSSLVQEIAAASMEQNTGAEQINNAIQQLNDVTQQNAAASEEMATSAEELSSQAEQLQETMQFFKIDNVIYNSTPTYQSNQPVKVLRGKAPSRPQKKNNPIPKGDKDHLDDDFEKF